MAYRLSIKVLAAKIQVSRIRFKGASVPTENRALSRSDDEIELVFPATDL